MSGSSPVPGSCVVAAQVDVGEDDLCALEYVVSGGLLSKLTSVRATCLLSTAWYVEGCCSSPWW
jgi:hypothetical protein